MVCAILILSSFIANAFAMSIDVNGTWYTTKTHADYSVKGTTDIMGDILVLSWIENKFGDMLTDQAQNSAFDSTYCYSNCLNDLPNSSTTWTGKGRGYLWVTTSYGNFSNPNAVDECKNARSIPAAQKTISGKEIEAYEAATSLVTLRDKTIVESFNLDPSEFYQFKLTDCENATSEAKAAASGIIPLIQFKAGDTAYQAFLSPDNQLCYVVSQDMNCVNHLYKFTKDSNNVWVMVGEDTNVAQNDFRQEANQAIKNYEQIADN